MLKSSLQVIKSLVFRGPVIDRIASSFLGHAYTQWSSGSNNFPKFSATFMNGQEYLFRKVSREHVNVQWVYAGANNGYFLSLLPEHSSVIAIEPNATHNQVLIETARRRKIDLRIVNSALSLRSSEKVSFFLNAHDALSSLGHLKHEYGLTNFGKAVPQNEIGHIEVDTVSLDDVISRYVSSDNYGLILDIQGGELDALEGAAPDTLSRCSLAFIEVSTSPRYDLNWNLGRLVTIMAEHHRLISVNPFLTELSELKQGNNPLGKLMEMDLVFELKPEHLHKEKANQ